MIKCSPSSIKKAQSQVRPIIILCLIFCCYSCTSGRNLVVNEAPFFGAKENFDLILFGCRHPDDIFNVAILDKEGDPYTLEVSAPEFEYKIKKSIASSEALNQAERFIRCSFHYDGSRLSNILGPDGSIIGYEVRPLYSPLRYRMQDVMRIQYRAMENRVVIYIELDPDVEAIINDQGDDREVMDRPLL